MQRYVAFLRAINVGGRRVRMDRLRTLFEALGLNQVETYIASGNVIFGSASEDAARLEQQIEGELQRALGYEVATFIRSAAALSAIAQTDPFPAAAEAGTHALSVAFLSASPGEDARQRVMGHRTALDDFFFHEREVYWLCRTRISESPFSGALLEKALGMRATIRNFTTVRSLAARVAAFG